MKEKYEQSGEECEKWHATAFTGHHFRSERGSFNFYYLFLSQVCIKMSAAAMLQMHLLLSNFF